MSNLLFDGKLQGFRLDMAVLGGLHVCVHARRLAKLRLLV